MNRLLAALALAIGIVLCSHVIAEAPSQTEWTQLSKLLGHSDSSPEFRVFLTSNVNPERSDQSAREYVLNFLGRGYHLIVSDNRVTQVVLHLLPGKKIVDSAYRGTMPLGLELQGDPLVTPETIHRLGTPVSDETRGHRKLTYERDGRLISLHLSTSRVEYISITMK